MVDGVSANFGVTVIGGLGESIAGALPGFTAQCGTNGLVSVNAIQKFRIQTLSYAAETDVLLEPRSRSSRNPVPTSSIGTAFDYLRNDIFDAQLF